MQWRRRNGNSDNASTAKQRRTNKEKERNVAVWVSCSYFQTAIKIFKIFSNNKKMKLIYLYFHFYFCFFFLFWFCIFIPQLFLAFSFQNDAVDTVLKCGAVSVDRAICSRYKRFLYRQ